MGTRARAPLTRERAGRIQAAMGRELRRSMEKLHLEGNPRPFFISYLLHHTRGCNVWGRYGSVFSSEEFQETDLYAEVRVGSHRFDQTVDGGLGSNLSERESFDWVAGPQDLEEDGTRYSLWKLTQLKYEEALQDYYDKKKILVEEHLKQDCPSFSREKKVIRNEEIRGIRFPQKLWEAQVRKASELFKKHTRLLDPYVRIRGIDRIRILVNSEGSRFLCQEAYAEILIRAWQLGRDGSYLNAGRHYYFRSLEDLPTLRRMEMAIEDVVEDLADQARARPLEPYAGPALLSGHASGLIFHEAVGHRLEGERMVSRTEGQTFAAKVGSRILPEEIDIIDDPSLPQWEGIPLYGHYLVDDEGVPARPVKLIEKGVLKTFLLSRACVPGFQKSNGHGRTERHQDPMARMSNLLVKARNGKSWEELKEMMLREVRNRGLPHGIIIREVEGGETRTDRYDFQAFKGVPTRVYKVDPRNGKETRVRNVNFIGTPLAVIQRILAFGEGFEVDNSYCFAESGSLPVSTVAPPMLVGDLELQKASSRSYRPILLPLPRMR